MHMLELGLTDEFVRATEAEGFLATSMAYRVLRGGARAATSE